jgi:hypothetical protein
LRPFDGKVEQTIAMKKVVKSRIIGALYWLHSRPGKLKSERKISANARRAAPLLKEKGAYRNIREHAPKISINKLSELMV